MAMLNVGRQQENGDSFKTGRQTQWRVVYILFQRERLNEKFGLNDVI